MPGRTTNLIVAASTFPRWSGDTVPPFVQEFALAMANDFKHIRVIAPHYVGAKTHESLNKYVTVKRFHYFWPAVQENIVYNGGGVSKVKKTPLYAIKLLCYCASLLMNLLMQYSSLKGHKIINAHWLVPQGTLALLVGKLVGAKVLIVIHGGDVFTLNGKYMRKIKRWTLKNADIVVVNSSATQAACLDLFDSRQYPIIPMGISLENFAVKTRAPRTSNQLMQILFVGRIVNAKGLIYLCQAAEILHNKGLKIRLDVVGDGPGLARISRFIEKQKSSRYIILHGGLPPSQLPDYYKRADIFVGPSILDKTGWKEAFGLVFAEALSCGTPVIATDIGGTRDIVKNNENGFIVPQKDPESIAERLQYIYDNPVAAAKLGRKGSVFVNKTFGWGESSKKYVDLFKDLGAS
jgi:glycosyltransferase involved in cell wall biosynthesis